MYEAAVDKFCKSVGDEIIHPPPSLDESSRCQPMQLLVKKNPKWCCQDPTYEPTGFSLSQVLKDGETGLDLGSTTKEVLTYNKIHKLSLSGKLGAKVKEFLEVELKGSRSVDVEAKFGKINKTSVDETQLMTILQTKHLNGDHEFIRQVREHSRKLLCVVVASYQLTVAGSLTAGKRISGEETIDSGKEMKVIADGEEDALVEDESNNSLVLSTGTVIGYKVCELLVGLDSSLTLVLDKDSHGGFVKS